MCSQCQVSPAWERESKSGAQLPALVILVPGNKDRSLLVKRTPKPLQLLLNKSFNCQQIIVLGSLHHPFLHQLLMEDRGGLKLLTQKKKADLKKDGPGMNTEHILYFYLFIYF